jgi:hypothetical protein
LLAVLGLAAGGALATSGCSTSIVRRGVERRIEKRLSGLLGPAEKYRVRIRGTHDSELVLGRARRVEVEGTRVFAKNELMLESLKLTLVDLRYEGGDPDFISVRRSDLEVECTDDALNAYLKKYKARYDPDIRFQPDQVSVRITYPFLGTPTPLSATGRLLIQEGRRLIFDADKADVPFITQPEAAARFVEDRVNPILDLGRIEFPARLENVQVLQSRIRAHGTAAIRKEIKD